MRIVKTIIKKLLFAFGLVLVSPLIVLTWLEALLFGRRSEEIFGSCKEILSLCPTTLGNYLRLAYYWSVCRHVSTGARFLFGSMIAHRDTTIASGVVVGAFTILGYADIGENVLFGARVSLISGKYQHGRPEERAAGNAVSEVYERLSIGRNSWIGQEAILMANVGENCTVAAGSAVYKSVPDGVTVMGNPARKVSMDAVSEKPERS
jgi:acetyltransferase-like isoleucine patch superfamily enzyme